MIGEDSSSAWPPSLGASARRRDAGRRGSVKDNTRNVEEAAAFALARCASLDEWRKATPLMHAAAGGEAISVSSLVPASSKWSPREGSRIRKKEDLSCESPSLEKAPLEIEALGSTSLGSQTSSGMPEYNKKGRRASKRSCADDDGEDDDVEATVFCTDESTTMRGGGGGGKNGKRLGEDASRLCKRKRRQEIVTALKPDTEMQHI